MKKLYVIFIFLCLSKHTIHIHAMGASMIKDTAIMIGAQMGASYANEEIGSQATDLANTLVTQSQTIQANIKDFQSQAQALQQTDLQSNITKFADQAKSLSAQSQAAFAISSAELNYLYQNISLAQPIQNYLASPIPFDQMFSQSMMHTPQGTTWYNPFSVGSWQYTKENNSFLQSQISPISITNEDGSLSSARAENNSIFGQYFNATKSYSIAGTITITQVSLPYFIGIMFNKSRWISGDVNDIRKCRMVGIYGKTTTDLGIYFAEQYTKTDALHTTPQIKTPLQQIIAGSVDKKMTISLDTFNNLTTQPVTFNFEITTSATSVTFSLWNDANIKQAITIDNLDAQIFTYHDIGFVCPGAIAQFTLTQPTDFIFSPANLAKYKE